MTFKRRTNETRYVYVYSLFRGGAHTSKKWPANVFGRGRVLPYTRAGRSIATRNVYAKFRYGGDWFRKHSLTHSHLQSTVCSTDQAWTYVIISVRVNNNDTRSLYNVSDGGVRTESRPCARLFARDTAARLLIRAIFR